jgi:predicted metal-dependent phosphoesterase TrpH
MHEIVLNLHMHTRYSDGHVSHDQVAAAALKAGIDAVIVTDHNVWVDGPEEYYRKEGRKVLLLVGEEVHDQGRDPQKNHLLVFGAERELATYAYDPQLLLDQANQAGGLAFLAHPADPAAPAIGETAITWVDWAAHGCMPSTMPTIQPYPPAAPTRRRCASSTSCWQAVASW